MTRLRLGIVGCGAVTERYHLPAVAVSDDVELVALVDPSAGRAGMLAAAYDGGAPRVLTDHGALAGLVDAAIIATPNRLHAPIACDLARAGVHLLVEKPLARTTAECDDIAEAARAGQVVIAVGHDFRHFPVAKLARELLAEELLGAIVGADLQQSAGGRWPYASTYVFSREESGGGVLIDFGVHMIDLLGWWLGDLSVRAYADDTVAGVETECEVLLATPTGANVTFGLSRLRPMRDTTIVTCERGSLEIGIFEPALVRLTLASGNTMSGGAPDASFDAAPLRTVFERQLADFVRAIVTGSEPLVPVADGRRVVGVVEECYAVGTSLRRAWSWPEAYAGLRRADDGV